MLFYLLMEIKTCKEGVVKCQKKQNQLRLDRLNESPEELITLKDKVSDVL